MEQKEIQQQEIEQREKSIKKQNRKALKKFIPILIAAAILGGIIGGLGASGILDKMFYVLGNGIDDLFFMAAPILDMVVIILGIILSVIWFRRAKKMYAKIDERDSEVCDEQSDDDEIMADSFMNKSVTAVAVTIILSFLFFGGSIPYLDRYIEEGLMRQEVSIVFFLCGIFALIFINQKQVDTIKRRNPEKDGSVYDMKFQDKWENSCDELEKIIIYKCAFKAYRVVNKMCILLWVVLSVLSIVMDYGALPIVVVSIIWLALTLSYCMEAYKLEKGNRK